MSLLYRFKPDKDRWLSPLLIRLHSIGISPNMVTITGLFASLAGAIMAAVGYLLPGLVLFTAGACLDCIDGSLARTSGRCTEFGRYLDGTSDRISEGLFVAGAVIGGAPSIALLIAIGSTIQLLLRTTWYRNKRNTDALWFSRPERFAFIVAGLLLPGIVGVIVLWSGGIICILNLVMFVLPAVKDRPRMNFNTAYVPYNGRNLYHKSATRTIVGEEVERDGN